MTMSRTTIRRSIVVALIAVMLTAPFVAWQGATGDARVAVSRIAPDGITVVGDSITARYNDRPGDAEQGWWSMAGDHFHAEVTTHAQSGSGYLRSGGVCAGDTFIDRSDAYAGPAPSILIVEGGRNDWSICRDGRHFTATDAEIEHAVDRYLDTLRTFLPQSTRIVVLGPPWGPLDPGNGARVTAIIQAQAKNHGMQFISTHGALTGQRVIDGVHPNRKGSLAIARRVIRGLDSGR
ncbi:SGNH/GDSL hydrolase family protein [Aeromicrobium sp.]|uniref:SGNH/GDSL hydrolase family protein n=1 Tax=Aeromicrobium sp. TaxID=1871063 RepID=UPI0030BCEA89